MVLDTPLSETEVDYLTRIATGDHLITEQDAEANKEARESIQSAVLRYHGRRHKGRIPREDAEMFPAGFSRR